MKWYKKQMDQMNLDKPELATSDQPRSARAPKHGQIHVKKTGAIKTPFVNPVAARNVNRPKTDSK